MVRTTPKTAALEAIATAMTAWSKTKQATDSFKAAMEMLEKPENLTEEQKFKAMDYFAENTQQAKFYVNLSSDEFCQRWLVRKLDQQ